jgi:hypothetical protein
MVGSNFVLQALTITVVKMVIVGEAQMVWIGTEVAITIEVVVVDPGTEEEVDAAEDEAWDEGVTEEGDHPTTRLTIQITQQSTHR